MVPSKHIPYHCEEMAKNTSTILENKHEIKKLEREMDLMAFRLSIDRNVSFDLNSIQKEKASNCTHQSSSYVIIF